MPESRQEKEARLRAEWIQGLREICDLFESKPELPMPYSIYISEWVGGSEESVKIKMAGIAKMLAPVQKEYDGDCFELMKRFGPHTLRYNTNRENVCERIVVGKKFVEAEPSRYYPEVPAHEEDVVEWSCSSLLAQSEHSEN